MAFADSIRTKLATMSGVASLLEGLLSQYAAPTYTSGVINTSSTTLVDYTGASKSITIPAGYMVLAMFKCPVSISGGTIVTGYATIRENSTDIADAYDYYVNETSSSAGYFHTMNCWTLRSPGAGTHTYKGRWSVSSNTIYSNSSSLIVLPLRIS